MSSSILRFFGFIVLFLTVIPCCYAHTFGQVRQNCYLEIQRNGLLMSMVLRMDSGVLAFNPDPNMDGDIDFEEWSLLLEKLETKLTPNIKVWINGHPVQPVFQPPGDITPDPRGWNSGAKASFAYQIPLPADRHKRVTVVSIADESFAVAGPNDRLNYFIDAGVEPAQVRIGEQFWRLQFTIPSGKKRLSQGNAFLELHGNQKDTGYASEQSRLIDALQQKEPSLLFVVGTLLTALLLGAAHALSPGHGKAMVGAFLVGTRGQIKDAFIIGATVAFTHVASVLLLGLVILFLSDKVDIETFQPWIGAASGCLIFFIGYWMLVRQAGHSHHHHHDHSHGHAVNIQGNTLKSLISMGIVGGMVPCPSAIVVLLAAVAIQKIGLGLLIILAFSLGLAAVLIVIAILAVTASNLLNVLDGKQKWVKRLPLASALVVMIAGIGIGFASLVNGGVLIFVDSALSIFQ